MGVCLSSVFLSSSGKPCQYPPCADFAPRRAVDACSWTEWCFGDRKYPAVVNSRWGSNSLPDSRLAEEPSSVVVESQADWVQIPAPPLLSGATSGE